MIKIIFLFLLLCVLSACARKEFYRERTLLGDDGKLYKIVETNIDEMSKNKPKGPKWIADLKDQLTRCWSVQAGPKHEGVGPVEVQLHLSKKREVLNATIVDQRRYQTDSDFRKAADSALRALKQTECKTLKLEPHKYETWKDMVVTFDPRDMHGAL